MTWMVHVRPLLLGWMSTLWAPNFCHLHLVVGLLQQPLTRWIPALE